MLMSFEIAIIYCLRFLRRFGRGFLRRLWRGFLRRLGRGFLRRLGRGLLRRLRRGLLRRFRRGFLRRLGCGFLRRFRLLHKAHQLRIDICGAIAILNFIPGAAAAGHLADNHDFHASAAEAAPHGGIRRRLRAKVDALASGIANSRALGGVQLAGLSRFVAQCQQIRADVRSLQPVADAVPFSIRTDADDRHTCARLAEASHPFAVAALLRAKRDVRRRRIGDGDRLDRIRFSNRRGHRGGFHGGLNGRRRSRFNRGFRSRLQSGFLCGLRCGQHARTRHQRRGIGIANDIAAVQGVIPAAHLFGAVSFYCIYATVLNLFDNADVLGNVLSIPVEEDQVAGLGRIGSLGILIDAGADQQFFPCGAVGLTGEVTFGNAGVLQAE